MKSFPSIFLALLLVGCKATSPVQQEAICSCTLFALSETERKSAILLADSGDKDSMRRLAMHFLEESDRENYYIWNMRLAEAGDKEAQEEMVCWHFRFIKPADPKKATELAKKWGVPPKC